MAIRPGGEGNIAESHVQWEVHKNIPELPSPILHQGRIYLIRDGGILTALDSNDGTLLYRKRLGATGHYRASPVIANGHLYLSSQEGVVSVVTAGDRFELAYQHEFDDPILATPAIDRSTLYIRTDSKLIALRH